MSACSVAAQGFGYQPAARSVPVLTDIDLSIPAGQRVLLLGDSGSGKSTLLRAVAGLLDAGGQTFGNVKVGETPATASRHRVGLLLQDPDAQLVLSRAGEEVAFGPQNRGVPAAEVERRVTDALDAVGFPYPHSRPVAALSGGERQRLALAGVLALGPDVLLLDEPTSMLDPAGAELVRQAVQRVADARGLTLVIVEHRVGPWLPMVDRVLVLTPHGIVADGSPEQVRRDPRAKDTWLVPPDPSRTPGATPAEGEVLLQADEVTYRHRGVDTDTLAPTSAAICAGSGLAVVGPNGSGKTTLARLLGGLVAPSDGDLRATGSLLDGVGEVRPDRWRPRELAGRIGSVFQNPEHSFLADTVRAELEVGPRALGEPESTVAATVEGVLSRLRLGHLQDANPFTLSGGEQRRLSVAAALTTAPRVLVLDEPTFGQDPSTWRELVGLMLGYLRDQGALAVMTHDVEFGERVCDRTLALQQRTPGVQ